MTKSVRALLESLVDYAGMFPPAALSFEDALRAYRSYREGEHAWALGRFVVPAARAAEVPDDLPVSILATTEELTLIRRADATFETKAASEADVTSIASAAAGRKVYVEIAKLELLDPIFHHRLRAKIRTGGVTPEAFPPIEQVALFISACAERRIPFKATAGLHHPLRCLKPLTYDSDAPTGVMHGFLNVFIAAALPNFALQILSDENPRSFAFDDGGVWWRDRRITTEELVRTRRHFARSFGSCSFEEPIADMKELGWL